MLSDIWRKEVAFIVKRNMYIIYFFSFYCFRRQLNKKFNYVICEHDSNPLSAQSWSQLKMQYAYKSSNRQ